MAHKLGETLKYRRRNELRHITDSATEGGPCDAQERVANGDQCFRDVRMQTGVLVRYELLMRYGDTLIYAHGLTLYQVMDLLVNYYVIGDAGA